MFKLRLGHYSYGLSFYRVLFLAIFVCDSSKAERFVVKPDSTFQTFIPPYEVSKISADFVPVGSSYALLQLHSQHKNVTLSSSKDFSYGFTKQGHDVGLVQKLSKPDEISDLTWFVKLDVNQTRNLSVVGYVKFYSSLEPVVGDCNQVFNVETDPTLVVTYTNYRTRLWFQWSNLGSGVNSTAPQCDSKQMMNSLKYSLYVYFLDQRDFSEDHYLDSVQKMLDPNDITSNGHKIFEMTDQVYSTSKPVAYVTSETDQGVVYGLIVTNTNNGHSASYITATTYACDFELGCSSALNALEILVTIGCTILGIFLLLFGHRFFKCSQFVFGFIFFGLLCFILISIPHTASGTVSMAVSATVGLLGGMVWFALWYLLAFPTLAVFVPGLCSGYLITATIFFTPFGNLEFLTTKQNYAICFACANLITTVPFIAFTRWLSVVASCLVGSFMLLMCAAMPLRSSLRLLFLNSLYHQTEPDYLHTYVIAPFLLQDILLLTAWPLFVLTGCCFHYYRERRRPAFEPPDMPFCRKLRNVSPHSHRVLVEEDEEIPNDILERSYDQQEERRPLLSSAGSGVQYDSVGQGGTSTR